MSRDVNNKYWDKELETMPREELEKKQLEDLKETVQFAYDHATMSSSIWLLPRREPANR